MSHTITAAPDRAATLRSLPGRIFDALVRVGERLPMVRALDALNGQSDQDLARAGTTREAEIRRILGARFY